MTPDWIDDSSRAGGTERFISSTRPGNACAWWIRSCCERQFQMDGISTPEKKKYIEALAIDKWVTATLWCPTRQRLMDDAQRQDQPDRDKKKTWPDWTTSWSLLKKNISILSLSNLITYNLLQQRDTSVFCDKNKNKKKLTFHPFWAVLLLSRHGDEHTFFFEKVFKKS